LDAIPGWNGVGVVIPSPEVVDVAIDVVDVLEREVDVDTVS
jgi:hypothetical protein